MSNERNASFSSKGEKKRCKTIDTKKDGADGSGQPLCVCFAYLRQICCLVSGTEGSPLTNWGCSERFRHEYVTYMDNF